MVICGGILKKQDPKHIMLCGPANAGKTFLLYKLRIHHVETKQLAKILIEMKRNIQKNDPDKPCDATYHYEEFQKPWPYAVWEIPGSIGMRRFWPTVYRSVAISGVVFMMDWNDPPDKIEKARKEFMRLLSADELRNAAIAVLINLRRSRSNPAPPRLVDADNPFKYYLGLDELPPAMATRIKMFSLDVSTVQNETNRTWLDLMEHIRKTCDAMKADDKKK